MNYPKFYDLVPTINLYDPLSNFLGATNDGIVEITYLDVVKYAGHSCATVAGAYLMTYLGLGILNQEKQVLRSQFKITAKGPKSEGTNGVIANVAAYICGVNDESGFSGIGGIMSRKNKLSYNDLLDCDLKFETPEKTIKISYNPSIYPPNPEMIPLMQKYLGGLATVEEKEEFKSLWQSRVKNILLTKERYNEIVSIKSI